MFVIVVGIDESGERLIKLLKNTGHEVVGVDKSPKKVRDLREKLKEVRIVEGDALEEETLELAGIYIADRLVIHTGSEDLNRRVSDLARALNPEVKIFLRGNETERSVQGEVYNLSSEAVKSLALWITKGEIHDLLERILWSKDVHYTIESVQIHPGSPVVGRKIKEFYKEEAFGVLIALVRGEDIVVRPSLEEVVREYDSLLVFGDLEGIENLISVVGLP